MDEGKIEKIRAIYYSMEKLYGNARENRHKARQDGDVLSLEYYKAECAGYHEMIYTLSSIFRILGISDEVFSTR